MYLPGGDSMREVVSSSGSGMMIGCNVGNTMSVGVEDEPARMIGEATPDVR